MTSWFLLIYTVIFSQGINVGHSRLCFLCESYNSTPEKFMFAVSQTHATTGATKCFMRSSSHQLAASRGFWFKKCHFSKGCNQLR